MRRIPKRAVGLAVLALGLCSFDTVSAQEKAAPMASPLRPTAADCKACHPRNYQEWEQSFHAKSVVAIHAGFKKYLTTEEQAKGRPLNRNEILGCIGCHAPAMRFASDDDFTRLVQLVKTDQKEALAGLSVDCVACHALVGSGHPETKPPEGMDQQVYYGTIRNPVQTAHKSQYAPQMEKSDFCKNCHTYITPPDLKLTADWDIICTLTYDSWAAGPHGPTAPQADRKECQNCHMEKKDGMAAEGTGVQAPRRSVSSHAFPGWHDAGALARAAELTVATRPGTRSGALDLVVTIENKAGHRFPDT